MLVNPAKSQWKWPVQRTATDAEKVAEATDPGAPVNQRKWVTGSHIQSDPWWSGVSCAPSSGMCVCSGTVSVRYLLG